MSPPDEKGRPLVTTQESGPSVAHIITSTARVTDPGDSYTVPAALRAYRLVPRQSARGRGPLRVTPGAFRAAGLPVPEDPRRLNVYQLTGGMGLPWTPRLDRHVRCRGAELHGDGLVLVDVDAPADGPPITDTLAWLTDRAGTGPGLEAALTDRTPGHPESGHGPGLHLWFLSPGIPVRMGPLADRRCVELRSRGTCPGSPGYPVAHVPARLVPLPGWLAGLAPRPRPRPAPVQVPPSPERAWKRLHALVSQVLAAEPGERNRVVYWASCRCAELVTAGQLEETEAETAMLAAAEELGLVREDGERAVLGTIRSGLRTGGLAA